MDITLDKEIFKVLPDIADKRNEACRLLIGNHQEIVFVLNPDGEILYISPSWTTVVGRSREQALGKPFRRFIHPDDQEHCSYCLTNLIETGETHRGIDYRVLNKNDQWKWHTTCAAPVKNKDDTIMGILGTARDIHDRKEAEIALQLKTEELEHFLSINLDLLCIADKNGYFVRINKPWEDILGYPVEYLKGKRYLEFVHPDDVEKTLEAMNSLNKQEPVINFVNRYRSHDGNYKYIEWRSQPFGDLFYAAARDITERKNNETALNHLNSLMRYIIEHNRSAVAVHDKDMKYMFVSQQYLESYRVKEQDVIGKHHYDVFPDLPQKWRDVHQRALRGEVLSAEEDPYPRDDGTVDWTRWECRPWYESDGSIGGIVVYTEIINDRKKMEQMILKEKEQFQTTLLSVGDAVISADNLGRVEIMNEVAEKLTGWKLEDAYLQPIEEVFCVENEYTCQKNENPVYIALKTKGIVTLANHTVLVSKEGRRTPIEDSAAPIKGCRSGEITGAVLVFRDYTEKRERQKEVEYLSFHDQLTGLYNRRFFEEELIRLDTDRNYPLSLAMIDVNGLKLINDAFGHKSGDRLLITVAEVLKTQCRSDEIISRIGGDEFMVLLPRTTELATQRLVKRIEKSLTEERIEGVQISVSFGVSCKQDPSQAMDEVLKIAEDLMYRDKIYDRNSQRYEAIQIIMRTLHEKTPREREHSSRVRQISGKIGAAMGLTQNEINDLVAAAELHDIGKIAIGNEILLKTGALSEAEWIEIKRHPEVGYNILSSSNAYAPLADIVLAHHERWDGKGYPNEVKGDHIPLFARIITIADSYDAMMEDRPYRKALSKAEVVNELMKNSGFQFDPKIANIFINKVMPQLQD